jgi:hypothetical protein
VERATFGNSWMVAVSEEGFIREMNRLTKDVFDEGIEIALKAKSEPYNNTKQNATRLINFNLNSFDKNPLHSYAAAIEDDAVGKDHSGELDLLSISWPNVVEVLEGFQLIMTQEDVETLGKDIDDLRARSEDPVYIALLLPAVQKVREAAERKGGVLIEVVMEDVIITSGQIAELQQQQRAAGYLGGLDLLVSNDFKKDNEMAASMEVTRAIYLNATAQLWHQAWEAYHE